MKVCYDWCMVRKYWNKAKVIFMAWTSPVVSRVILRSGRTIEYLFGVFEGAMEKTFCLQISALSIVISTRIQSLTFCRLLAFKDLQSFMHSFIFS